MSNNTAIYKTWQNLFFRCLFTILPFIIGMGYNAIFGHSTSYYANGEFVLYSVSLLASSILAYDSLTSFSDIIKGWLNIAALMGLVILSCLYATIMTASNEPKIDPLKTLSIFAFTYALLVYYFSQLGFNEKIIKMQQDKARLEYQLENSDPIVKRKEDQDDLLNALN